MVLVKNRQKTIPRTCGGDHEALLAVQQMSIEHLKELEYLFWQLMQVSELTYSSNGSHNRLPGTISISFKDTEGEMILHRLDLMGIAVSAGSACNSKETKVSHVLIHLSEEYATGTIRITLGKENTSEDIVTIVSALKKILDDLDVIECFEQPGSALRVGEATKKQEDLYKSLGVTPPGCELGGVEKRSGQTVIPPGRSW